MIISRTPLRISLVGGGTDMKYFYSKIPGKVISLSINKYIYIIVKKRFDKKIVVNYTKREIVDNIDDIKHSLVRECLRLLKIKSSIEITSIADIPSQGSGLGSSSTFTVGLLNALFSYNGEKVSQEYLAELACKIEIDICGAPIGKQDQYGSSIGGIKVITFNSDDSVDISKIADTNNLYENIENQLIIVSSGLTRSASEVLKKQENNFEDNLERLKEIVSIVDDFNNYLIGQNFEKIYDNLNIYWEIKSQLVENKKKAKLEKIYNHFIPEYCHSGKICGAGAGGYFMFFAKNLNLLDNKYLFHKVRIDREGSVIIYNNKV
tara:strand:+ start:396 stop:1358 length:963 start_codon:yes stop_codon:yes gene_type:complete